MHPSSAHGADKIEDRVDSGREPEPRSGEQDQAEGRNMLNEEQPEQTHIHDEEAYSAVSTDEVEDTQLLEVSDPQNTIIGSSSIGASSSGEPIPITSE